MVNRMRRKFPPNLPQALHDLAERSNPPLRYLNETPAEEGAQHSMRPIIVTSVEE